LADQVNSLFPTLVLKRHLDGMEETNRQLAALMMQKEQSEPNHAPGTSTSGGFQTEKDLLTDAMAQQSPALATLRGHIGTAIRDYAGLLISQECSPPPQSVKFTSGGWGVILREGNYQGHHVHPGTHVSGVYYIAAPAVALAPGQDGGKISFFDPRPRAHMNQLLAQRTYYREAPGPGDLVLFPSWLEHSVAPFRGEGLRICIAFDARLEMR
jgi:uncharacterized protein (TIGR02466 family)